MILGKMLRKGIFSFSVKKGFCMRLIIPKFAFAFTELYRRAFV